MRVSLARSGMHAVVSVDDTGPGLLPGERDQVFRRFYRAERARQTPGNGLGLGLVAAIAALHGFSVEAEASAEGGARFAITAPLRDEAARRRAQAEPADPMPSRAAGPEA